MSAFSKVRPTFCIKCRAELVVRWEPGVQKFDAFTGEPYVGPIVTFLECPMYLRHRMILDDGTPDSYFEHGRWRSESLLVGWQDVTG